MLELTEGRHSVVDPIEQQKNADAGEGAGAKTDKQTL